MNDWWAYNIATDTWSEGAVFPGDKRHHPYFFGIDSLAYVGFGHGQKVYNDFYSYHPTTDTWRIIPGFPAQPRVAGTQFSFKGKGYILSGQGADHDNLERGEFWVFDPITQDWDSLSVHPGSGRWAPGSFVIGEELYLMAGESDRGNQADLWSYSLVEYASVPEMHKEPTLRVSPNPASTYFTVEVQSENAMELYELYLISAMGQVVYQQQMASNKTNVDVAGFKAGLYGLRVTYTTQQVQYVKVLVSH